MPRSVDDQRPMKTTSVLSRVVGMVPGRAIELGLEAVGEAGAGSNRTLLDRGHSIIPWGGFLEESVPMEGGTFFGGGNFVMDSDLDCVPPIALNGWLK